MKKLLLLLPLLLVGCKKIDSTFDKRLEASYNRRNTTATLRENTIEGHRIFVLLQGYGSDSTFGMIHLEAECPKCTK